MPATKSADQVNPDDRNYILNAIFRKLTTHLAFIKHGIRKSILIAFSVLIM